MNMFLSYTTCTPDYAENDRWDGIRIYQVVWYRHLLHSAYGEGKSEWWRQNDLFKWFVQLSNFLNTACKFASSQSTVTSGINWKTFKETLLKIAILKRKNRVRSLYNNRSGWWSLIRLYPDINAFDRLN